MLNDISVTNNKGSIDVTCKHNFNEKNNQFLASAASCTSPEKYYYTCSICGEKGSGTYAVGSSLPHTFDKQVATSKYLVKSVKCVNEADYYYSCSCGEKGTEKFKADASWSHKYGDGWFISAEGHWHQCIDCGAKKDFADHIKNSDGICSKCYFVIADDVHQHSFGGDWKKSEDAHWHECSCGLKDGLALHNWDGGKETKPATESKEGEKLFTCTDCGQTKIEKIEKLKVEKPTTPSPAPISKTKMLIIAGAGVGALVVLEAIGFGIYAIVKKAKKKGKNATSTPEEINEEEAEIVEIDQAEPEISAEEDAE